VSAHQGHKTPVDGFSQAWRSSGDDQHGESAGHRLDHDARPHDRSEYTRDATPPNGPAARPHSWCRWWERGRTPKILTELRSTASRSSPARIRPMTSGTGRSSRTSQSRWTTAAR
jgi:hypothetical protein